MKRQLRQHTMICGTLVWAACRMASAEALTWEACTRLAKKHNPTLRAAHQQVVAAQAGLDVAGASDRPQATASANAGYSDRSNDDADGAESYSASLGVRQNLYSGGRNPATIAAAEANLAGAVAAAEQIGAEVTSRLRFAFIDLLYAQELTNVLSVIRDRRADNCELVELRYAGGREHKGSMALSRASRFEAEMNLQQAKRRLAVAQKALWRITGLEQEPAGLRVTGDLTTVTVPEKVEGAGFARNTPEYLRAEASVTAAQAELASAISGYRPSVALDGNMSRAGDNTAFEDDQWSVGLRLSLPLWTGGRNDAVFQRAEANLTRAEAQLSDTYATLASDMAEAANALHEAAENVFVRRTFLDAYKIRAEISRQQYADGLLAFENWDIIENELISASRRLLEAHRSAQLSQATWWRRTGRNVFTENADRGNWTEGNKEP